MSSNDFNYINQYSYPQNGAPQQTAQTSRLNQPDSARYYQQTAVAMDTGNPSQEYQRQRYPQSRSNFDNTWYGGVPGASASNQAISAGTVQKVGGSVNNDTVGGRSAVAGPYDTSALGSLAYASGLQYSTVGSGSTLQTGAKASPTPRNHGGANQSARIQAMDSRYQAPVETLPAAAKAYQGNRPITEHANSTPSTTSYAHQPPLVNTSAQATATTTASLSSRSAVVSQTSPQPSVPSYQRNISGSTAPTGDHDVSMLSGTASAIYQSTRNQQPYQYAYNQSQNRSHTQSPAQGHAQGQTQLHASHSAPAYMQGHGQTTQNRQTPVDRQGRSSPAITTSQQQKQSLYQNYQDYNTSQTRVSSQSNQPAQTPINQTVPGSLHARQASAESHRLRWQDHEAVRAPATHSNTDAGSPFLATHQKQQTRTAVQDQPTSLQSSNSDHTRVVTPSFYTQQQQVSQSQVSQPSSSSNVSTMARSEQRLPSPQPSTPATVNPSHVYNAYHEYRREIEAAEVEQAKLAKEAALQVNEAASAQIQQENQQSALGSQSFSQWNTISASEATSNVMSSSSEQRPPENHYRPAAASDDTLRNRPAASENDAEVQKKKLMMEKMLELMREDPTLFSHAVEELKNSSPQIPSLSGRESVSSPQVTTSSQPVAKPKKKRAPRRKKIAANTTNVEQSQPEPPGVTTGTSSDTLAQGADPLAQGAAPQMVGSVQSHNSVPPPNHSLPQSSAPSLPQASVSRLQQHHSNRSSPHAVQTQPIQTNNPRDHGPTSAPLRSLPQKATSVWPESKKEALGINAVRFLTAVPENAEKSITARQICAILDGSPSYVELCEEIEKMGFKLDRVKFAKALLAVVPDGNNAAASQAQQPSKNNSNSIPAGSVPSLAIKNATEAPYNVPPVVLPGFAHNSRDSGVGMTPTVVNPVQAAAGLTPVPFDTPSRRGRGRPRKDGTVGQVWARPPQRPAAVSQEQMSNGISNVNSSAPDGSVGAPRPAITGQQQQTTRAVQNSNKDLPGNLHRGLATGVTNHLALSRPSTEPNIEHRCFTPLNNSATPQPQSNDTALDKTKVQSIHKPNGDNYDLGGSINADCDSAVDDTVQTFALSQPGAGPLHASAAFASHAADKDHNASRSQSAKPTFSSTASPSNLLSPAINSAALHHKNPRDPCKSSFAEFDPVSVDDAEFDEPPLPDHLSYLDDQFKRVETGSKATTPATNANRASSPLSMGLPSGVASNAAPPSSKSTTKALSARRSQLLASLALAQPLARELALKKSTYNSKTIARDILVTLGRHPEGGLNLHLERIKLKTSQGQTPIDLSTLDWEALDPEVPVLSMEGSENLVDVTEDEISEENSPKIMRRTRERLAAAGDPANRNAVPINTQLNSKRKRGSGPDNGSQRRSGRAKPVAQPLGGPNNTPAQPSRLRHELKPTWSTSQKKPKPFVLVDESPLLSEMLAVEENKQMMKNRRPVDPGPSGYLVYECYWNKCQAKLHNFSNLERHMDRVHLVGLDKPFVCYWKGCLPLDEGFVGKAALREHISSVHLKPVEQTLGRGPRASSSEEIMPDMSSVYLSDNEGRRVIQETSLLGPPAANRGRSTIRRARDQVEKFNTPKGLFDESKQRRQTLHDSSLYMARDDEIGHRIIFPPVTQWKGKFQWKGGLTNTTIATESVAGTSDNDSDGMDVDVIEE